MKWIDHGTYLELDAPQGDPLWEEGRWGRITSTASYYMNHNNHIADPGQKKIGKCFKTLEEQCNIIARVPGSEEKFDPEAIRRMDHGNTYESVARDWLSNKIGKRIIQRGLIVSKDNPIIAGSIDGEPINEDGTPTDEIVEIKCPEYMYESLNQYMLQLQTGWKPRPDYFKHIFPNHFCQMMHLMAVMGKKFCTYIVYSTEDKKVFTQRIPFDPVYWEKHYKIIKENYLKYVVPLLEKMGSLYPL